MGDTAARDQVRMDPETEDFAQQIADQVESFLLALRAIARGEEPGSSIPLLLLEVSQVLLAGGRLGVHEDFQPLEEYEPDPGPDPDLDDLRLRLAVLLEPVDAYTEVFDPYVDPPEMMSSLLSDDLTSIASDLENGLRHYRAGDLDEALRRANAVEYGLSASIFTSSLAAARRFVSEIEAGIVRVNGQTAGADVHVPFGGIKASGFGPHEQGRAALEFYTEVVTVYEDV